MLHSRRGCLQLGGAEPLQRVRAVIRENKQLAELRARTRQMQHNAAPEMVKALGHLFSALDELWEYSGKTSDMNGADPGTEFTHLQRELINVTAQLYALHVERTK